jgi:hypothetical protein
MSSADVARILAWAVRMPQLWSLEANQSLTAICSSPSLIQPLTLPIWSKRE